MLNEYIKELSEIYKNGNIEYEYTKKEISEQSNRKIPLRRVFKGKDFVEVRNEIQNLTEKYLKKIIDNDNIEIEFKPGLAFNLSTNPWIQIYTKENSKATSSKSTYMGIDFKPKVLGGEDEYKIWVGYGISNTTYNERIANSTQLVEKIKEAIGDKLDNGFEYIVDDSGIVIKKKNDKDYKTEDFERDVKYLSKIYYKFTEASSKGNNDEGRNVLFKDVENLDYIYSNYLNHTDEKYIALMAYKPDYKLFITDIGNVIKKAMIRKSKDYYLIIKDIDKYPSDYLQELIILLNRDAKGKSKYAINNTYLSRIVFNEENKKVYIPENLKVFATTTIELPKELEDLFTIVKD